MARVTVEDCIEKIENRFELVLIAANRARVLANGVEPTIPEDNDKPGVISLREIADETIPIEQLRTNVIKSFQSYPEEITNEENSSESESDNEENSSESDNADDSLDNNINADNETLDQEIKQAKEEIITDDESLSENSSVEESDNIQEEQIKE
tara:strand:- start:9201 stop:9662 length:462 start_codon:yes stop_codon:yes gene_type:complete